MADLLSAAQHAQIRAALQDVFDTFHDTPVKIYIPSEDYVDEWMEDVTPALVPFDILGFVEYAALTQGTIQGTITKDDGSLLHYDVKVQLGLDDMKAVNLINTEGQPVFVPKNGYFEINGEKHELVYYNVDGAFEKDNVLCYIYGKKYSKPL